MTTPSEMPRSRTTGYSDTCDDAIAQFLAFYRSAHASEVTHSNLQQRLREILARDHDPSETLHDARQECRYGCTVGTVAFIESELESMVREAAGRHAMESGADAPDPRFALLREAHDSAGASLKALRDRDLLGSHRSFRRTRDALSMFRALCPADAADPAAARVFHATAVAWEMLCYSTGK